MLSLIQVAVLAILAFAATDSAHAYVSASLSQNDLTELYNEIPQQYREHLYLPGISEATPSRTQRRKLGAVVLSCNDADTNCQYFQFYCNVFNASYMGYPLIQYCAGTCNYCQLIGSTTTTVSTTTYSNGCLSNPCQNSGICITRNPDPGYDCLCVNNYVGPNCEYLNTYPPTTTTTGPTTVTSNSCQYSPCKNGGSCTNTALSFTCACVSGYFGPMCEYTDPCVPSPCANGGVCFSKIDPNFFNTSFTCLCSGVYYGTYCNKTFTQADCYDKYPRYCNLTAANCSSAATIFRIPVREACTYTCITGCTPTTTSTTSTVSTTTNTATTTTVTTTVTTTTRSCNDLYGSTNCGTLVFYCNKAFTNITIGATTYTVSQACQKTCGVCT